MAEKDVSVPAMGVLVSSLLFVRTSGVPGKDSKVSASVMVL